MKGVDFSNLFINLSSTTHATLEAALKAGAATINYGLFVNAVIDPIIIAFAIFIVIKQMNWLKKEPTPAEPVTKDYPRCLLAVPIKVTSCGHYTSEVS